MSPELREALAAGGAVFSDLHDTEIARRFQNPAAEYAAVRESAGVAVRSDLVPIRMWGRDPARMLHGLVTNDVLDPPPGQGVYSAMLTAKGRMIAEMRSFRLAGDDPELLLLLPREALEGTAAHLKKFVPPMFARWADAGEELGVLGIYGPRSADVLTSVFDDLDLPEKEIGYVEISRDGERVLLVNTGEAGEEIGFDVVAPTSQLAALWTTLLDAGAPKGVLPVGFSTLETLRVEAGRPRYGAELTDATIPTEAYEAIGWMPRAISFTKGCYTGQEVIVRIAHRGHVNRHLRGLLLGDVPTPAAKTPLFHPETGKEIGWTTSAAVSPQQGQTIALAFVRRELNPGDEVRLGDADGPAARVAELPFGS